MKKLLFTLLLMSGSFSTIYCQVIKFDITLYPPTGNIVGKLYISDSLSNPFTGTMVIDNDSRELFGWNVIKISTGPGYNYTTTSLVFYVNIAGEYQHQQLFKGILSADQNILCGDYFYYGNEYPFIATRDYTTVGIARIQSLDSGSKLYPNPVQDYLQFDISIPCSLVEIFDSNGNLLKESAFTGKVQVSDLPAGIYFAYLSCADNRKECFKFIKNK